MQARCNDFIKYVLNSDYSNLLMENKEPLATQLAVMLMIHRHNDFMLESTIVDLGTKYKTVLQIVVENQLMLPEEDLAVTTAIDAITEEGEGAAPAGGSPAPANVVAGIEPTTPRIKPKKKLIDEKTD